MSNLYIRWLSEVDLDESPVVGLDFAKLGKLQKEYFNISPGFIITPLVFFDFLKANKLQVKIQHLYKTTDFNNPKSINQTLKHIRDVILKSLLSEKLIKEIITAYRKLNQIEDEAINIYICIDGKQKECLLNIRGDAVIIEKIKTCFAHVFNENLLLQNHKKNIPLTNLDVSLLIQKTIKQDLSGFIHTVKTNPWDKSKLVIYVKNKNIHFEIDKETLKIQGDSGDFSSISKKLISEIAKVGINLEKIFYFPQTINWFLSKNIIYIDYFKEITSTVSPMENLNKSSLPIIGKPIQKGIASGAIRIVTTLNDLKKLNSDEIAVINDINLSKLIKCRAIIFLENENDVTTLFQRVNLKIPIVSVPKKSLNNLRDGHIFTVNGITGEIITGGFYKKDLISTNTFKSATKIYKNILTNYDLENVQVETEAGFVLDGNLLIKKIGIHPKKIMADKKHLEFTDDLSLLISDFAKSVYPTPILYKTSHLTTNEYADLTGGREFETIEANSTLGFRGGLRHGREKEIFELELVALEKISDVNLELIVSFVRTPDEFNTLKAIINKFQFAKSANFKLWLSADLPSNLIMLNKFINSDLYGIFLNLSQVNSLMIGYETEDFNYFEKTISTKEISLWVLESFNRICQQFNIESVVYDNSLLSKTDILEKAIRLGIGGVSVAPKDILEIKKLLMYFEKRLLLK